MSDKQTIYNQHDKAFNLVSAYVLMRGKTKVATIGLNVVNEQGFDNIPIRFFIWDDEIEGEVDGDYIETNEQGFLEAEGVVEYERFTVFDDGCKQICLTKNPFI